MLTTLAQPFHGQSNLSQREVKQEGCIGELGFHVGVWEATTCGLLLLTEEPHHNTDCHPTAKVDSSGTDGVIEVRDDLYP